MTEIKKQKIAFLFGAGAERASFNLPSGEEFSTRTLYENNLADGYRNALKKVFHGDYFKNYKYTRHHIENNIYQFMLEKIVKKDCTDKEKSNKETTNLLKKSRSGEVCKEFEELLKSKTKSYENIKNKFLKEILDPYKDELDYLSDIGTAGLLDDYFHTIINPAKYSKINFSKIFNYYWSCYFVIIEDILKSLNDKGILGIQLSKFYKKTKSGINLDYEKLISEINYFTSLLYSYKNKIVTAYSDSYYNQIKNSLEEKSEDFELSGVVTTNYFIFPEILKDDVVYLNGKLSLFEFPENLEVLDFSKVCENFDDKIYFPFIFCQSYLKPIVNKFQAEEFYKFGKILDNSDMLVILGYNINEDDNHVNAFIHDFLKDSSKKLLFVTDEDKRKNKLLNQLKIEETNQVRIIQVDYKKTTNEIVEEIFLKIVN